MLYKRQADMLKMDQKINELQSRLARKLHQNQQLASQVHPVRNGSSDTQDELFSSKSFLRSSMGHPTSHKVPYSKSTISNIATVEPQQRLTLKVCFSLFFFHLSYSIQLIFAISMIFLSQSISE